MNALTWDIKPFAGPKNKETLLSVVALLLLCAMSFLIVSPAISAWCLREHLEVTAAIAAVKAAEIGLAAAKLFLKNCHPDDVWLGLAMVVAAQWLLNKAELRKAAALEALRRCQEGDSGSCDESGSCGS